MTGGQPRLSIATHYQEGSISAIARAAVREHMLSGFYTSIYTGRLLAAARRLPLAAARRLLERRLGRRAFPGIPADDVHPVMFWPEVVRFIAYRLPGPEVQGERMNYAAKEHFDRAVAARIENDPSDIVVSMYAASARTFRSAHLTGKRTVLNLVNSHPRWHNRYLRDLAGVPAGHHELVPEPAARRIEDEIDRADLILVPSRFIARQLLDAGIAPERIAVEPYGVDLNRFRPLDLPAPSPPPRLRCLYVGAISHRKGISVLLDAARRLQSEPVDFELVGPGKSLDMLARMPANVRWHGPVLHADLPAKMAAADIFVLPSIEDAYPLVGLEAMASGLAPVVSDHAGTSELLTDGVDGLVVPAGDELALATAIKRLVQDRPLLTSMKAAARRRVEHGQSWDDYGARVVSRLRAWQTECVQPRTAALVG
jgi:glycosyltransferase involved in cell wall biosynthesis